LLPRTLILTIATPGLSCFIVMPIGVSRRLFELEAVNQPQQVRESVPARSLLSSAADVIRLCDAQQVG